MNPRVLLPCLLHALLITAMAGCSHMPVTSMVKLARVDFETSDPAQLRAAIKLPRTLRPQPNGVALRIAVQVGRAPEEARDFMLRELPEPAELTREAGAPLDRPLATLTRIVEALHRQQSLDPAGASGRRSRPRLHRHAGIFDRKPGRG